MKTFVVVLALALVAVAQGLTEEQKKKVEEYSKECLKESKVEESVLKEAKKGVYLDDPKLRTHAFCFAKKIKMVSEKGELQVEVMREKLKMYVKNEEEVGKLVELCLVEKESPVMTAFEGLKCLKKNMPKDVVAV